MILYHGTNTDFEKIDLHKSKPNKDFGQGFYLSDNLQQAKDMASLRVELAGGEPLILKFSFNESLLTSSELKVLRFEGYTEDWAKFIIANRSNKTNAPVHNYDIVIGPIANDRVGRQLWRYNNHDINMPTLIKNLKYMKGITIQYFFGTERAIQNLTRL